MRVLLPAVLCAASVFAQQSPEAKAYDAAYKIKEPAQKIVALDRFLVEYPSSNRAATARRELIVAAVAANPKDAVRRTKKMAAPLPPAAAAELNRLLAAELNTKHKLPRQAEQAARQALQQFTYEAFAAEEKGAPPTRARYDVQRARIIETLAQSLLARGKSAPAKAAFLESLAANPSLAAAAIAAGDILEKEGNSAGALPYYAQALLARSSPEARAKFSGTYLKANDSAAGSDDYLDQRYRALFPSPLHPEKYQPTPQRTARVVLAEVYTGAGCPPCLAADLSFDAVLERFSRRDVAVVMYHEHIPRPDPMANDDTVARWKWQAGRGVPTYAIDGDATTGGGSRDGAAELETKIRATIERRLETAPGATLTLAAVNDGRTVRATVALAAVGVDSPDLALNVLLVEKELRYSGENGIRFHPMVVRSIRTFPLNGGKARSESHTFDLAAVTAALESHIAAFEKHDDRHNKDGKFRFMEYHSAVDPADLAVVAFVQDTKTRAVLQAVYAEAAR